MKCIMYILPIAITLATSAYTTVNADGPRGRGYVGDMLDGTENRATKAERKNVDESENRVHRTLGNKLVDTENRATKAARKRGDDTQN